MAIRAALEVRTYLGHHWARTQTNLGNTLWLLGERGKGHRPAEETVTASGPR